MFLMTAIILIKDNPMYVIFEQIFTAPLIYSLVLISTLMMQGSESLCENFCGIYVKKHYCIKYSR